MQRSNLGQAATRPRSCPRASQLCAWRCQSQAGATLLAGDGIVGLLKLLEQLGLIGGRDARSGVTDRDIEQAIIGFGLNGHFPRIRELDDVADQMISTCVKRRPSPRPAGSCGATSTLKRISCRPPAAQACDHSLIRKSLQKRAIWRSGKDPARARPTAIDPTQGFDSSPCWRGVGRHTRHQPQRPVFPQPHAAILRGLTLCHR